MHRKYSWMGSRSHCLAPFVSSFLRDCSFDKLTGSSSSSSFACREVWVRNLRLGTASWQILRVTFAKTSFHLFKLGAHQVLLVGSVELDQPLARKDVLSLADSFEVA